MLELISEHGFPATSTREISEHGFPATSTREISEHLGFTKAALSYDCRAKDDRLVANIKPAVLAAACGALGVRGNRRAGGPNSWGAGTTGAG